MTKEPTLYDTMAAAYDRSIARQLAKERALAKRNALDQGATIEETMANVYDRLHPEQAPHVRRPGNVAAAPPPLMPSPRLPADNAPLMQVAQRHQWPSAPSEFFGPAHLDQSTQPGFGMPSLKWSDAKRSSPAWQRQSVVSAGDQASSTATFPPNEPGRIGHRDAALPFGDSQRLVDEPYPDPAGWLRGPPVEEDPSGLLVPVAHRPWSDPKPDSMAAREGRLKFHEIESMPTKASPEGGYRSVNPNNAWGMYQNTRVALKQLGLISDVDGKRQPDELWLPNNKYGVRSLAEFLDNEKAQEDAFEDLLLDYGKQLSSNGALVHLGRSIDLGGDRSLLLSIDNLLAAAHKEGARAVNDFLSHLDKNGWRADPSKYSDEQAAVFRRIMQRLREFENTKVWLGEPFPVQPRRR